MAKRRGIFGNSTASSGGAEDCRCIDASDVLASLDKRSCTTSNGQDGILLSVDGPCVDHSFGSTSCLPHDLMVDPDCKGGSGDIVPEYCNYSWCYVDGPSCMEVSSERVFRSPYFPAESGVNLFWSYSTCGSSPTDWIDSFQNNGAGDLLMGGVAMTAIAPAYNILPYIYKRNANGDIPLAPGGEYYNNSVPLEGVYMNYVRSLEKISEGDFSAGFVHGSRASRREHPASPGTAAVQDVADGLADIAVGPIWITGDRLRMTTFTMPIQLDKTVLVIPKPGTGITFLQETKKVLDPFTWRVWVLLLGIIAVTALLSVWFSGQRSRQPSVYARLALDQFLQNGTFFASAGVEQNERSSLPRKLLMFGFAFFTLIVVSSYVANLAAFLTRSESKQYVDNIEDVIAKGMSICAHPALEGDLRHAHPGATFVFNQEGKEMYGLLDDYKAGSCDVMAVGMMDSLGDLQLMDLFCENDLVYTDSLVIENQVGFPIRSELAPGFSYWMYQGEKYNSISIKSLQVEHDKELKRKPTCNVILSAQGEEADEYAKIDVENLLFPIMFFGGFALLGVILQLCYQCSARKARSSGGRAKRASWLGTHSTLNLDTRSREWARKNSATSVTAKEDDEEEIRNAQLSHADHAAVSIVRGTIESNNTVHLDGFRDNQRNMYYLDSSSQENDRDRSAMDDTNIFPDSGDDASLPQVQRMLDEFIDRYQKVKNQRKRS